MVSCINPLLSFFLLCSIFSPILFHFLPHSTSLALSSLGVFSSFSFLIYGSSISHSHHYHSLSDSMLCAAALLQIARLAGQKYSLHLCHKWQEIGVFRGGEEGAVLSNLAWTASRGRRRQGPGHWAQAFTLNWETDTYTNSQWNGSMLCTMRIHSVNHTCSHTYTLIDKCKEAFQALTPTRQTVKCYPSH